MVSSLCGSDGFLSVWSHHGTDSGDFQKTLMLCQWCQYLKLIVWHWKGSMALLDRGGWVSCQQSSYALLLSLEKNTNLHYDCHQTLRPQNWSVQPGQEWRGWKDQGELEQARRRCQNPWPGVKLIKLYFVTNTADKSTRMCVTGRHFLTALMLLVRC